MNVFKIVGGVVKTLFGGGGSSSPVETVAKVVDEYKFTDEEKDTSGATDLKDARQFAAPGNPLGLIGQIVDGANHAMRPWITFECMSRWFGYRPFPDIGGIDPKMVSIVMIVLTFWFGGRLFLKDLPMLIASFKQGEKK